MPVNIVQPLLNFHVFSLADKGKKGNSVSFTVHFKTLQDSSALESLEHFILQVQKISCPMTLTDPVHRRFDGTNYYSCPRAPGAALDASYVCRGQTSDISVAQH